MRYASYWFDEVFDGLLTDFAVARISPAGTLLETASKHGQLYSYMGWPTSGSDKIVWVASGRGRVLPEGGQIVEIEQYYGGPDKSPCANLLLWWPPTGTYKTVYEGIVPPQDELWQSSKPMPLPRLLDKLGDWWAALYPEAGGTPWPETVILANPAKKQSWRVLLAPSWQVATLALAAGDKAVVAGTRAGISGQPAVVVEQDSADDWKTLWRTTIAAPYGQKVHTVERMPAGGVLVVTSRTAGTSAAVALLWLDAKGALVHERIVAVTDGAIGKVLTSVREEGTVAIAVQVGKTWRFATLDATSAWNCHATTQACPSCDDGNACTDDTCVAGRCHHAAASVSTCPRCDAGVCASCQCPADSLGSTVNSLYGEVCLTSFECVAAGYCVQSETAVPWPPAP